MAKTLDLKKLEAKKYIHIEGLPQEFIDSLGKIEEAFDAIIYGESGNGKTNFAALLIVALLEALKCKCEYVSYEEAHGQTMQELFIHRHKVLERLGNVIQLTDHYTYDELVKRMARKQSAKIWVIDSIQASKLSKDEWAALKSRFVFGKKKKILIAISWADGKKPQGADAKAIEYYANIKMRVDRLIMFPKSRYGGNKPFIIWEGNEEEGALFHWGSEYWKLARKKKPTKGKKKAEVEEAEVVEEVQEPEVVTHIQIAEPLTEEEIELNKFYQ